MRKFSFLLLLVALLAGCSDGPTEPAKYQPGNFVESVVTGQLGQVICINCSTCETPKGKVAGYKVRMPAGTGSSLTVQNTKGSSTPQALATEYMCEFELRPAQQK